MTPDRFESSSVRPRLPGRFGRRGIRTGLSTPGTFALGGVFVLVGSFIVLVGTKTIPVDPKSVHAPYWVLTVVGLVFALAGLARRMNRSSSVGGQPLRLAASIKAASRCVAWKNGRSRADKGTIGPRS